MPGGYFTNRNIQRNFNKLLQISVTILIRITKYVNTASKICVSVKNVVKTST